MSEDEIERVRQRMLSKHAEQIARFDETEYLDSMIRVRKLFAEKELAVMSAAKFEKQVRERESRIHEMELKNQRLELQIESMHRKSSIMFALSLLATVLVGMGVNIATSTPYGWTGWVMIVTGCILEGIAFLTRPNKSDL